MQTSRNWTTAAVAGVGNTKFGKAPGNDAYDMTLGAFHAALADCGLPASAVDGIIIHRSPDYQRFCELAGINPKMIATFPSQGRMSGVAIATAAAAIAAGVTKTVALIYGNIGKTAGTTYGGESDTYGSGGAGQWFPYGMTLPGAMHAMMFRRHMQEYGTKPEHLAQIAMTFRRHAALNPGAVMRELFDKERYFSSRFICDPLRLLDYCLINDGAVAMIVTSVERARDLAKPPATIRGYGQATALIGSTMPPEDYWRDQMQAVARDTEAMSGLRPEDMNALMIYDNFTPTVLFSLEGFGFAPIGESGPWVMEGHLALDGRYPSNTSGGHLSESYMQGWALNAEAVRQIEANAAPDKSQMRGTVQFLSAAPITTSIIYGADDV